MNNKIFENHLVGETSPYLLQHIHNPVDWYPWGEEAFNKSKHEDKPIFLSIGYSACHWCHVMARESFEDESIAQILNENFICIKIDREQRPDIDSIYMRACQAATGSGGWPLSVFTDAEGKPFFAGTYYPKEFFYKILQEIAYQWKSDKDVILQKSEQFCDVLKSAENNYRANQSLSLNSATEAFLSEFDSEYGGFGNMPKFPTPHNLMFLLYTAPSTVEKTLDSMYKGGIFDHIGGGFSRYSTDRYWLVPHFEKMLYDNALLAIAYSMGFETIGKDIYKYVVKRIFEYLERDLLSPKGGFYSSQDADSEGEEGKFYLFSVDEIKKVLGEKEGQNFCEKYGIDANGNFRGKSIPNLLNSNDFETRYENELKKLFEYRKSRISPNIDTKILTSWNCLTAAAYAVAGRIFKNEEYIFNARKMTEFIRQNLFSDDVLISSVTEGKKSENSFLDDYAFYIYALIEIYEATFDEKYLTEAVEKTLQTQKLFGDANGGFYFSSIKNEKLILRPKETFDGATPSGNSVMSYNLNRLYILTENDILRELHIKQRKFMDANASIYPTGHGFYLYSCLPVKKVVCVPKIPKSLLVQSNWTVKEGDERIYPVINQKTTYYVCENETCHPPTNEI